MLLGIRSTSVRLCLRRVFYMQHLCRIAKSSRNMEDARELVSIGGLLPAPLSREIIAKPRHLIGRATLAVGDPLARREAGSEIRQWTGQAATTGRGCPELFSSDLSSDGRGCS